MCILEINLNVFSGGPVCRKEKMAGFPDFFGLNHGIYGVLYGNGENWRDGEGIHWFEME